MMQGYETVIGLEVHAQMTTKTKIFCSCKADSWEQPPNTNVCPVCLGLPGSLGADLFPLRGGSRQPEGLVGFLLGLVGPLFRCLGANLGLFEPATELAKLALEPLDLIAQFGDLEPGQERDPGDHQGDQEGGEGGTVHGGSSS